MCFASSLRSGRCNPSHQTFGNIERRFLIEIKKWLQSKVTLDKHRLFLPQSSQSKNAMLARHFGKLLLEYWFVLRENPFRWFVLISCKVFWTLLEFIYLSIFMWIIVYLGIKIIIRLSSDIYTEIWVVMSDVVGDIYKLCVTLERQKTERKKLKFKNWKCG